MIDVRTHSKPNNVIPIASNAKIGWNTSNSVKYCIVHATKIKPIPRRTNPGIP